MSAAAALIESPSLLGVEASVTGRRWATRCASLETDRAIARMVQAGIIPVTWQQVLLEWQRDWARKETYDAVTSLVKEHSGAYGMGIDYAVTHVHGGEERVKHGKRIGPNPANK